LSSQAASSPAEGVSRDRLPSKPISGCWCSSASSSAFSNRPAVDPHRARQRHRRVESGQGDGELQVAGHDHLLAAQVVEAEGSLLEAQVAEHDIGKRQLDTGGLRRRRLARIVLRCGEGPIAPAGLIHHQVQVRAPDHQAFDHQASAEQREELEPAGDLGDVRQIRRVALRRAEQPQLGHTPRQTRQNIDLDVAVDDQVLAGGLAHGGGDVRLVGVPVDHPR
jgi:hypothetical protein